MKENVARIFDAPLGINNVDSPKSDKFQLGGEEKPFLTKAQNVDILRTGHLRTRAGRTKLRTLTNAHSGWACPQGAFYVDSGILYKFDPKSTSDSVVFSGINAYEELSYADVAGQVFWCNGEQTGRIISGQHYCWGLQITDPPTLSVTTGSLRAGTYSVAVASVSEDGVESGCRRAATITVTESGGINVFPSSVDPLTVELNVYLSDTNGKDLFYHSTVPVGSFTITTPSENKMLFTGLGGYPPPAGHIVREWRGYLIVARSEPTGQHALYFSEPGQPHRFHVSTDVQLLPSRCSVLEPMNDGFFYALEDGGTFWVEGTDPHDMRLKQVDDRIAAEQRNSCRVSAHKLPWLQTDADIPVPLWVTQDGWAAGLPNGDIRYPVESRVAMDTNRRATVSYVERSGLKQILSSVRSKQQPNTLSFGDKVTATVTKGG